MKINQVTLTDKTAKLLDSLAVDVEKGYGLTGMAGVGITVVGNSPGFMPFVMAKAMAGEDTTPWIGFRLDQAKAIASDERYRARFTRKAGKAAPTFEL